MKNWKTLSHVRWDCKYHIVFITKYRHRTIYGKIRNRIGPIIRNLCEQRGIELLEGHVMPDHIHMVVRGEPKMAPSDVMQVVKSISAREFFRRYPEIRKRYFWGGKLWTQSYFVETIGNVNEEVIRAYVRDQLTEYEKREAKSEQLGLF